MRALMFAAVLVTAPGVAAAQGAGGRAVGQSKGWNGPLRVSASFGTQVSDATIEQSFDLIRNIEPMPVTASIDAKRATLIDAGAAYKVAGRLAIAYAFSSTMHDTTADVSAAVPHPFFFDRRRPIEGTVPTTSSGKTHHVSVAYIVPAGRSVDVMVLGGPSWFSIRQTLVNDVTYREEYPYDTAAFNDAKTTLAKENVTGYHVGVDVAVKLTRHVGLGGLARFSRGSTTLTAGQDNTAKFDVGGLQAGGGLRLAF